MSSFPFRFLVNKILNTLIPAFMMDSSARVLVRVSLSLSLSLYIYIYIYIYI